LTGLDRRRAPRAVVGGALAALLALLAGGCSEPPPPKAGAGGRPTRPHLVEVATAERRPVARVGVHTGTLRARRTLRVFVQEEGRITALPFFEGDRVQAGDLVLRLDDTRLRAELDKAAASRAQAEVDRKRLEGLSGRQLVSEDELARARTAAEVARAEEAVLKTRLGYAVERAPFDGVVSARLAEPGDVVARYTHVLTLTDPASLVTEVSVSELILPELGVGDPVEVRIDALGPEPFPGRVLRLHPALDPRSRRGVVEVALAPVPPGAQAGQFARVTLRTAGRERLLVPFTALQRDRDREVVYRLGAGGRVERVPVRSGERFGTEAEVLEGLAPGDRVVVRGLMGLREGQSVEVVPGAAGPAPPAPEAPPP
jgi:membrane fusion protein (multidrug efflux system)